MIFGSTAAKFWFPDFREPKDLDILTPTPAMARDVQHYWFGPSSQYIIENNPHPTHVCAGFLFTIKAAHAKWNIHWDKTMADIVFFQRRMTDEVTGALPPIHDELYRLLMIDFTTLHGKKWASLKGEDSKTFFEDAVTRKYVHDTIHDAVSYYDEPLYHKILVGDGTVSCSREKFEALSLDDRLKLVKEEVFVTALERFLVPEDFKFSTNRAYWLSLKKLITTMSSGWFSRFIIENYSALAVNRDDYVATFKKNQHKLQLC